MNKFLRLGTLAFILILGLLYIQPLILVHVSQGGNVYAASKAPTPHDFAVFEVLHQWQQNSGGCPHDDNDFEHKITVKNYNKDGYYGYNSGTDAVNTSSYVDVNLPGDGGDERTKCSTIFKAITTEIFGSRKKYLDTIYDTKTVHPQADDKYYYSNDKAMPGEDDFGKYIIKKINEKIKEYEDMPDWSAWIQIYGNDRVIRANERCKNDNNVIVGYLTELTVEGAYSDGKVNCDRVKQYYKDNDLANYDVAAETLKLDPSGESEVDTSGPKDGGNDTTAELEDCSDKGLGWNPGNWLNNGLDWFGCQVAKAALSLLKYVSGLIAKNLETTATTSSDDESSKADEALKSAWGNVLVAGNILFVIGFLIMILSTILNISFVDAYTVKKFLPRIVIAALFANASWFIVSQAINITNMLGSAVPDIIMSPLKNVADANIKDAFSGTVGASLFGLIAAGTIPAIGAVASGGIFVFVPAVLGLLFAALTAIIIIVLRKLIIFALIVFAPLAIALWAIPGLDKWAGRWWKLLIEMLMVYPFIIAMFTIGEFAAVLTLMTNGSDNSNPVPGLMAIALLCAPLLMLPTVFKLASSTLGNITGMVNDKSKGLIDRSKKSRNQKIAQGWDRKYAPRVLQTRANAAGWLMGKSSEGKRGARFLANRVGGYNIEADMSARNLQDAKVINGQIDTGRDGEIRGLTVNRAAAKAQMEADMRAGNTTGGDLWQKKGDKIQYKSLGGEWVDSAEVEQGHKRWGNNQFAKQAALAYEIRKADTSEKVNGLKSRYADLATKEWGLSDRQAGGNWKGATFEHQNTHLALKHTNWKDGKTDVSKLATELYEKRGAYPASNMVAQTFEELGAGYETADADTQRNIRGIAETFVSRGRLPGQMGGMDEEQLRAQQQVAAQQAAVGGGGQAEAQVYASGAAHTNQAINKLARQVGVLDAPPSGNAGVKGGPVVDGDSPQKENGPL